MREWLSVAYEPAIVRRAPKYAIVVGAVLIAISHGDALLRGDLDGARLFRFGLTVVVPSAFPLLPVSRRCAVKDVRPGPLRTRRRKKCGLASV